MKNILKPQVKFPAALNVAAYFLIIAGLMQSEAIVNPFLMGLFISIVCAQPIGWLNRKKVPLGLAVFIVLSGIIAVFIGFSEIIGKSLSSFSENADLYEENLNQMGVTIIAYLESLGVNVSVLKISNLFDVSKVMNLTAGLLGQLGGFMGNAVTIIFLAIFLLLEMNSFSNKTNYILKNSHHSIKHLNTIIGSIRHYLSIKTVTSLITGGFIWVALEIIGVDYAIIWGLIAFLLNFIPNIGSIIAAIPAVLFSVIQLGFTGGLWTSVVFLAVNMIVGNMVEPKMMGKGLGLSTFVVFVSLLFWGFVLGTVGMFLSVPLTMAIKIILEQNKETQWIAILLGSEDEVYPEE